MEVRDLQYFVVAAELGHFPRPPSASGAASPH